MSAVKTRHGLPLLRLALFLLNCEIAATPVTLHGQTASAPLRQLEPGPRPPDASEEWKQLVGIYGMGKSQVIVMERENKLVWHVSGQPEWAIEAVRPEAFMLARDYKVARKFTVIRDNDGNVSHLRIEGNPPYLRGDAESDPTHFYHVTPSHSVEQLRAEALQDARPPEKGPFRKPDLVEIAPLDPGIHFDIRCAQSDNFLSTPVYSRARAFMQRPAAEALLRVLYKLRPLGYELLIHDAYRPWYVTKLFWDATPPAGHAFVADPAKGSKHNRGCAVDITLYDLSTGQPIQMPGLYDEMSPRSFPEFPGGTSLQRWHRDLLRRARESEGLHGKRGRMVAFRLQRLEALSDLECAVRKTGQGLKERSLANFLARYRSSFVSVQCGSEPCACADGGYS